jgi:hypothetical protein
MSSIGHGVADASIMPTDMPIGPPDPLPYPSEDPTGIFSMILNLAYESVSICSASHRSLRLSRLDHWFCGIGFDDANAKCEVHCPTAKECPLGQSKCGLTVNTLNELL